MSDAQPELASFRDPSGSVFHVDGRVLRALDDRGAADWRALRAAPFFERFTAEGRLVATEEAPADLVRASGLDAWALVLEHERVPFISYPYEWSFEMLRDAAILQLELLLAALDDGLTTKDGYAYNVQFRGASPVFIDTGSFEGIGAGGPWVGYRQFCQTFLYPLLLQAHLEVPFQRYLLGHLEGLDTADVRRLLGGSRMLRRGVLRHVVLHDVLSSRFTEDAQATRQEIAESASGPTLMRATAKKLLDVVGSLQSKRSTSGWADYRTTCSYSDEDRRAKERFVDESLVRLAPGSVWDLGCNDGAFSRIAAARADHVVAVDGDDVVIDGLYRTLRRPDRPDNVLPLVLDLTDPSPARGWRGTERKAFFDRGTPDAVLALALVHHLAIAANVPLVQVLDWFASMGSALVVEFVEPHDPMAQRLLANKPAGTHDDYRRDVFEKLLAERYTVERDVELPGKSRRLYLAVPRR